MTTLRLEPAAASGFVQSLKARPALAFFAVAIMLTALRVAALGLADAELGPDEAQYWVWSQSPAFGYFSKPPLIAWTIALTTGLFGDAEWAVRLASPLFHLGTAICVFALARMLYGEIAGFWAGVGWITIPGVAFSAALMTTDAPLLFFWSAALYLYFRILKQRDGGRPTGATAALLGAAVGAGFLAKYAMIYFLAGAALAQILAPAARGFRLRDAAIALGVAALIVSPNLVWNAAHEFQTLAHTAANAKWGESKFHPVALGEFLAAQLGVFGPILIGLLVWGAATMTARRASPDGPRRHDLALLAFVLPPILVVCAQAFISRAHANWAATAYPAAMVLVVAWALRAKLGALLKASLTLHVVAAAVFMSAFFDFAIADRLGLSNAVKPLRGWEALGAEVRAAALPYDAVLVDDRELMGSLLYYSRGGKPVVAWNSNQKIDSHYEAFMKYDAAKTPRAVFVSLDAQPIALNGQFASVTRIGEASADLRGGRSRTLYLFAVEGWKPLPG